MCSVRGTVPLSETATEGESGGGGGQEGGEVARVTTHTI